ncbi:ataxin-1-like [Anguilla anguilla]|uniref:ataxin-1-like n=1 Tax=Anguilla anguilla TaxID=7936 RepID=UPI0015AA78F1|nr:ataxin-1-like [Anguilla anguilla]
MKPVHERNQECLPPKKRDLPVSSSIAGGGADGGGGEEGGSAHSSDSACREPLAGGSAPGEWIRVQPGAHYSVENPDGLGVPIDQYGMLYKVALTSGAYPPTSLHPVLSHIPSAYSVPSSLLQHPGIPYPPLGYAHIPHSSLQLVSPPYAVPYAVPPGFVPGSLLPPQTAVPPQAHHIPHLVPYPSVIQGGVVSPPPQTAALGPAPAELHHRATPVFYHHAGSRTAQPGLGADYRDSHLEREKEVNGGEEEERGGREPTQDPAYSSRGPRAPYSAPPGPVEAQRPQDRAARRFEARASPGLHSTPDSDLEVQQAVSRLASPDLGVGGSRKQASLGPLSLTQGSQREREEALLGVRAEEALAPGRIAYAASLSGPDDPRLPSLHPQPAHHAVLLANGQPVLVPLDYQQQRDPGPPNDIIAAAASPKAFEPPAAPYPPERPEQSPASGAVQPAAAPPPGPGPSHFTKGAIIQLATGELKRVEDLQTQDFVRSAEVSGGLKIDSSMVVDVRRSHRPGLVALHFTVGEQQSKVAIDVPPEHPFFVFGQGWSSCSPDATARLYGLDCHHLQAGDVCVSIALQQHKPQQPPPPPPPPQTQSRAPAKAGSAPAVAFQPMGPPAPQHHRPPAHFRGERPHRDREEEQGHGEAPPRADRTPPEHTRSRSAYRSHTEGPQRPGAAAAASPMHTAHRRCSAPGFQKYQIKSEDAPHPHPHPHPSPSPASPGSSRPTFIPQEVKLSIEGRSNAGK